MTVASELRQYPFEPFTGDIDDELLAMVETDPISQVILPDGRPCWLVLDYEGCCTVLADPRFSRLISGATGRPARRPPLAGDGRRPARLRAPDRQPGVHRPPDGVLPAAGAAAGGRAGGRPDRRRPARGTW